jgi:hypothetical protein
MNVSNWGLALLLATCFTIIVQYQLCVILLNARNPEGGGGGGRKVLLDEELAAYDDNIGHPVALVNEPSMHAVTTTTSTADDDNRSSHPALVNEPSTHAMETTTTGTADDNTSSDPADVVNEPSMHGMETAMTTAPTTAPIKTTLASSRTMVVFVTSKDNDLNRNRIAEMRQFFNNNLLVVWNHQKSPLCPFQDMKDAGLCLDEYPISKSRKLSHMCCAQEMALHWAIDHRQSFDYIWFMEDDVYATDIQELDKVISLNSTADFLHQRQQLAHFPTGWFHAQEVLRDSKGLFQPSEMRLGLFNLFRMTPNLLTAVEEVYNDLGQEWFFFEVLFPSVVASKRFNLTDASWPRELNKDGMNNSTYYLKVRPQCKTHFEEPGIYHPAKYMDGKFVPCPNRQFAPDVKEGSPYKNQV